MSDGRCLFLPDILRDAGLKVLTVAGWETRGRATMVPAGVVAHHTATTYLLPTWKLLELLVKGRTDLPGPLCQLALERDATFYVVASGRANHAGFGSWRTLIGNSSVIGIEAANYGNSVAFPTREPWPMVQLDAYDRGSAAILAYLGRDASFHCAHREWAPERKPDPSGIVMDAMRSRVARLISSGNTMIIRQGITGAHIRLWKVALNETIRRNALPVNPLDVNSLTFDANMAFAVSEYQKAAGIGGMVELGALDDYTRDLLVEFSRADA